MYSKVSSKVLRKTASFLLINQNLLFKYSYAILQLKLIALFQYDVIAYCEKLLNTEKRLPKTIAKYRLFNELYDSSGRQALFGQRSLQGLCGTNYGYHVLGAWQKTFNKQIKVSS